jgi:hypothetical protein
MKGRAMAKTKTSRANLKPVVRFTVDLGKVNLNDKEVSSLKNKIIRLAVAAARPKRPTPKRPREPYVKIVFGKAIPPY